MSNVIQAGQFNFNQLQAPGAYVQILPPNQAAINGVQSNIIGVIGTAVWGAKNSPVVVGGNDMTDFIQNFGPIQKTKFDMGTAVLAAVLNGANNFRCVRVTDGTDAAASKAILTVTPSTGFTATAIYTGSLGNQISIKVENGTKASTYRVIVALPNSVAETFDNIAGSGLALWTNIVNAINQGQSGVRGPSELIVATVGVATTAPALSTYVLTGGTDGNSGVDVSDMVGTDTSPGTGMYALRNTQSSIGILTDCDDATTYTSQAAFGDSEGIYMIGVGPAGQTPAQAATALQTAGVDTPNFKLMIGDWCYILDTFNNVTRLISPQGFVAGRLANLTAPRSSLNQQIAGIVSTQKSQAKQIYTSADIIFMAQNRLDVIANPSPGGKYFATQTGQNSSSNSLTNDDGYTRLTNYLAYSIVSATGVYVGLLQDPDVRGKAKNLLDNFLRNLQIKKMIGDVNGGPAFQVILGASNNPSNLVALGFMQASVKVVAFRTIRIFLINLENGLPSLASVSPN